MPDVIDSMIQVPDLASIAAMLWLEQQTGRKAGPSTGTNLWGAMEVAQNRPFFREESIELAIDFGSDYTQQYWKEILEDN